MTTDESLKLMETLGAAYGEKLLKDMEGMKVKHEIEIDPKWLRWDGCEYEADRVDCPKHGEFFLAEDGSIQKYAGPSPKNFPRLILKRKQWEPKHQEQFFYIDHEGDVISTNYDPEFRIYRNVFNAGNCYRTREEAAQAAERVRKAYKGDV